MAQPKPKVMKSKSSESVLTKLSRNNSKSRSNAELTPVGKSRLKKGMYVKRKPTEASSNDEGIASSQKEQVKAPRRPSPGEKRFLTSALKLLAKSTTSTQYPDDINQNTPKIKKAIKETKNKKPNTATGKGNTSQEKEKKKKKYKSKILNSNNYGADQIQVLQRKRNIDTTSSIVDSIGNDEEDFDKIKWSDFLPRLVKPDDEEIKLEKEKKLSHLVREVTEGRMETEKKINNEKEEPTTLVSEQKDPGFYDFFVDLLETTFSVYNMKTDYQTSPDTNLRSVVSSKVAFEIDKAVADKLKVGSQAHQEGSRYCCFDDKQDWKRVKVRGTRKIKRIRPESPELTPAKNNKRASTLNQSKNSALNSRSLATTLRKSVDKKKQAAKTLKQNLLSMIKEQLLKESNNYLFQEKTSLFHVLKVMAENKRKSQKTTRFDKSCVRNDNEKVRKRKVYHGFESKSKHQEQNKGTRVRTPKIPIKKKPGCATIAKTETTSKESNHSLVVYSYHDHEKRGRKQNDELKPSDKRKDAFNMMQQVLLAVETVCRNKSHGKTS